MNWKKLVKPINKEYEFNKIIASFPDKPNVFWYVSAGIDFRGCVYLSDYIINKKKSYGVCDRKDMSLDNPVLNCSNREYEKPDFFVFNCIGYEIDYIKNHYKEKDSPIEVFSDKKIEINVVEFYPLKSNEEKLSFGAKACLLKIEMNCLIEEHKEYAYVLYFEEENINFFNKVILKNYFNVLYLCATREGCGCGGCRKSIIDYIYKDNSPSYFYEKNFRPKYIVAFHNFTNTILKNERKKGNIDFCMMDHYIREARNLYEPDSTVYLIKEKTQ